MALASFILLSHNSDKIVAEGGNLHSLDVLDSPAAVDSYFFVLDGDDVDAAFEMLRAIRSHADTKIYLKPVVLGAGVGQENSILSASVDIVSHVNEATFPITDEQEKSIHAILAARTYQQKITSVLGQQQISLRILRFMASRNNIEQLPIVTPTLLTGYSYPQLEMFFSEVDSSIWEMLESLKDQHLLEGRFISRVYRCTHCESAFLNFMETCPDCESSNIKSDELIHHFRCGHAAPMAQFRSAGGLICPKCEKGLKHIGVDYDKPSLTFSCNECRYVFEEPVPTTVCYNCGRRTNPEDQVQRTVYAYKVSALGVNIALFGQEQLFTKLLKENLELINNDGFQRVLSIEIARIARYKLSTSCVLTIEMKGLADALVTLGDKGLEFYKDLADVFVAQLRCSDILTIVGRSVATVLLTETDAEGANLVLNRLIADIDRTFDEALSIPSGAVGKMIPVNADLDIKKLSLSLS